VTSPRTLIDRNDGEISGCRGDSLVVLQMQWEERWCVMLVAYCRGALTSRRDNNCFQIDRINGIKIR
jgi:hypothetical protein